MSDDVSDDLTTAEYQALARFRSGLRVFLQFSEQAARDAGVTTAQHQLMLAIKGWDGDGSPSISDVAARLLLRHHSASELIDRAVDGGLVERGADPDDGRRHLLSLTPSGDAILAALSRQHRDELRRFRRDTLAQLLDLG